jgi:hypothetical protein
MIAPGATALISLADTVIDTSRRGSSRLRIFTPRTPSVD